MRLSGIVLSVFVLLACAGCSKDAWLRGKWVFDREYTEAQLSAQTEPKPNDKSIVGALKSVASGMLTPVLMEKLDGMTCLITDKEIIATTKEGTGTALSYEVVDHPTKDSWLIKTSDGKVATYYREGERLAYPASGDLQLKLYFKRASP